LKLRVKKCTGTDNAEIKVSTVSLVDTDLETEVQSRKEKQTIGNVSKEEAPPSGQGPIILAIATCKWLSPMHVARPHSCGRASLLQLAHRPTPFCATRIKIFGDTKSSRSQVPNNKINEIPR
jgi:hypothetical protein